MIRVVHVITGLGVGGAEGMLVKLLRAQRGRGLCHQVVSLLAPGPLAGAVAGLGVPVHSLGMRRGRGTPFDLLRLAALLRRLRPDVVQTWMYHADLAGGLAARLAGGPPVAWNLRHSNLDPALNGRGTLRAVRACAALSGRLPAAIVCGSEAARGAHLQAGYAAAGMVVIANGFDLDAFRPDAEARRAVRAELGLCGGEAVVGIVGRFHEQKDHGTFVRAAGRVAERHPGACFVLCGEGVDAGNRQLAEWIARTGHAGRFLLLGVRDDPARVMAAFDVAVSSSAGEGFPNAVGEAMACGVPCVVTDVGDSALLVGDTGVVVPPGDPDALAAGMLELLEMPAAARGALGCRARQRVQERYSVGLAADRYESLYRELAGGGAASDEAS